MLVRRNWFQAILMVVGALLMSFQTASAQSDRSLVFVETKERCNSITPKQQLVLERRALGGDQRAQYVIATCAWPSWLKKDDLRANQPEVFRQRVLYTYKWATLAYCDRQFNDLDRQTRELENDNKIYERRRPVRDLREDARKQQAAEVGTLRRIRKEVNDELYLFLRDNPADASREFVEQMDGLGASGLVSLALMRDCPTYPGFEQRHARVAVWDKASDEFSTQFRLGTKADEGEPVTWPSNYVESLKAPLSEEDKRFVEAFKERYGLYDFRERIGQLGEAAALGRMGEVPVQYLQLALGAFRKTTGFQRGIPLSEFAIDNVYGEKTSKLAKAAQSNYCAIRDVAALEDALRDVTNRAPQGLAAAQLPPFASDDDCAPVLERSDTGVRSKQSPRGKRELDRTKRNETDYPTGWLSPLQARALICRAAVDRNDPYSYLHLAQMFANGYGYPINYDKALFSIQRAQRLFSLGPPSYASNHKDLKQSKIEREYKVQALELEQEVYRKAASALLGKKIAPGEVVEAAAVSRINSRVANANYDETGRLCIDEIWRYWDPGTPGGRPSGDDAAGGGSQSALQQEASSSFASSLSRRRSLPVAVSVDAPATLSDTRNQ